MTGKNIYLDYNSTTPVDPGVLKEMIPFFNEKFGNASSVNHRFGWDAEEAVDLAREQVASLIDASPKEIYFTSGATESINIALQGTLKANREKGHHIITCYTEHKAVLDACHQLQNEGNKVTFLPVSENGLIDIAELETSITKQTILICIMLANNETGVIQPIHEISKIARQKGILVMTDATQAVGKIPVSVEDLQVDLMAFSAHKLYGPKGVGALYVRKKPKTNIQAILHGGGHERGLRPGTLNVPGIVGFGKACEICGNLMMSESDRLQKLRDYLEEGLLELDGVSLNGNPKNRLPHTSNVTFNWIDGSKLIRYLKGLAVSQGSACTSATVEPSHVLKELGLSDQQALSSIRFSLGRFTTPGDIEQTLAIVKEAIQKLRLVYSERN